ncbi:hypothetical protein ACJMK2_010661 [Sinanodonta woodiana]|uniref:Uncharacterized protein n=1 Tax=Sinanodonta woodiana TaxID=1069815 RepID=A0ABD3VJ62_SINWO
MKMMKKENVGMHEMVQRKDSELRLGSDLRAMVEDIKSLGMIIEIPLAVNEIQIKILSAPMRGIHLQLTNHLQLSCSYANITRSFCSTANASSTSNTDPNTRVIDNHHL